MIYNPSKVLDYDDGCWDGPPCQDCGFDRTCEACKAEDAYYEYIEERVNRLGIELAMLPDEMECYACGRHLPASICQHNQWGQPYMMRRVVGEGPIAEAHRDPTSTYRLVCGHIEM
jgi:hypothetical protein